MHSGAEHTEKSPLLTGALRSVTRMVCHRPLVTLVLVAATVWLAVWGTVSFLTFKTDRADLIDPSAQFHQRWLTYTESFGDTADLVVAVEAEQPETIKQVIDEIAARLKREPELFTNVLYKLDSKQLQEKGLQFLNQEQLEAGLQDLRQMKMLSTPGQNVPQNWNMLWLDHHFQRMRLDIFYSQLNALLYRPEVYNNSIYLDKVLDQAERVTVSLDHYLYSYRQGLTDFQAPWREMIPLDPRQRDMAAQVQYLMNDAGTIGFVKVVATKESQEGFNGATAAIDRLREIIADVKKSWPKAEIGLTGIPVLESDEMRESQSDMILASIVSLVLVGMVLFIGFRGLRHPLLAMIMLGVGMAWAFGYTTATVGHLNILSVSFAVILIGLGIDFAIHYLARYLELRHEGEDLLPALEETSSTVGSGIVAASITTALAFFCATFTQFLGVAELGVIAGGGILLCALATFIVLPALVSFSDQNVETKALPTPFKETGLRHAISQYPLVVLALSLVVVVTASSFVVKHDDAGFHSRVTYDYNLLNLQAEGLDSVEVQKRIFKNTNHSLLYAVSVAETPEQARILKQKFEALPTVHHVDELASRLPAHAPEQTKLQVLGYRALLAGLNEQPPSVQIYKPAPIGMAMDQFYNRVRMINHHSAKRTARILDRFLDDFSSMDVRDQLKFLNDYQTRFIASLHTQLTTLKNSSNPEPITLADFPPELASRYVSKEGQWLLQIYPKEQVWDLEPLAAFVKEIRSVDEKATGTPLQNYEASQQIMRSYETAAAYALAVIFLVLLIDFLKKDQKLLVLIPPLGVVAFLGIVLQIRQGSFNPIFLVATYIAMSCVIAGIIDFSNLRDTLLAMLPPLIGGLLMFGLLGLFKVNLNPANLIVLPLLLGIGVDDGVHIIHDYRMQNGPYRPSSSTMNGIILTSLTSMIGFGSMMIASHRGLYSVGLVMVIGVGSCLFVSLIMLPATLTLVSRIRHPEADTTSRPQSNSPSSQSQSSKKNAKAGAA